MNPAYRNSEDIEGDLFVWEVLYSVSLKASADVGTLGSLLWLIQQFKILSSSHLGHE